MDLIYVILSCELEWIRVTQWWTNFVRTYSAERIIIVRQNNYEQNTFFWLHSGEQIVLGYIQNSDGDSDDDFVFPHLANGYANPVEIGVFSIDLSDDEDTKSNEEEDERSYWFGDTESVHRRWESSECSVDGRDDDESDGGLESKNSILDQSSRLWRLSESGKERDEELGGCAFHCKKYYEYG